MDVKFPEKKHKLNRNFSANIKSQLFGAFRPSLSYFYNVFMSYPPPA